MNSSFISVSFFYIIKFLEYAIKALIVSFEWFATYIQKSKFGNKWRLWRFVFKDI